MNSRSPVCAQNDLLERKKDRLSPAARAGIFASTALAVAGSLAWIAKSQKLPLALKSFFKLEIEEPQVITMAASSIAGGFIGGVLFDDEKHIKAKARESFTQMFGNVLMTLGCVSATNRIFKNAKPLFRAVSGAAGLTAGIFTGNVVSNFINEKLFGQKVCRHIRPSDFAPHVDDVSLTVALVAGKENMLGRVVSRIITVALLIPGLETGKAREHG